MSYLDITNLKNKILKLTEEMDELKEREKVATNTITDLCAENERLKESWKESEEDYLDLQYDYAKLEDELQKVTKCSDTDNDVMEEIEIKNDYIQELQCKFAELRAKFDDMESYNTELEAENNRLREAYEEERNKPAEDTQALHDSIDILTKQKASLKEHNQKLIDMLDDLREENKKLKDYIIQMILK